MIETVSSWELDVDRGPNWLFVKVRGPKEASLDASRLAERVWALLQEHFTDRLILELDEIGFLSSSFVGQLVLLHKRIALHGGLMRLCGLSSRSQEVLHCCRLDEQFSCYHNREEAVMGICSPRQPE
jgi:anti-anti-sigma factor